MSTLQTFLSGGPVVGREKVKFLEEVVVAGERREIEFEREVLWLRESEARLTMRHGGERLDAGFHGRTYTDFWYGADDAKARCARLKVTRESSLEVLVEGRVYDRPVLFSKSPREEGWQPEYAYLPGEWRLPTWEEEFLDANPDAGPTNRWHPRLEEREVRPWTRLWSSQWEDPDVKHASLVAAWKEEHMEKES